MNSSLRKARDDYMSERVGFWRSLWLVLKGSRLREYVTYRVTEESDPEGGLREVWTRAKGVRGERRSWRAGPGCKPGASAE